MTLLSGQDFGPARVWTSGSSGTRLNFVYVALAAVNLLTVAAAVFIGYKTLELISERVEDAQRWSAKQAAVHELADSAQAVFVPASEVFLSRDVEGERQRLEAAVNNFEKKLVAARNALSAHPDVDREHSLDGSLERQFEAVERYVRQGQVLGRAVLQKFSENDAGEIGITRTAAGLMTKNNRIASRVDRLAHEIAEEMADEFIVDLMNAGHNAEEYRKSLAAFGALMILLIMGTIAYGLNLSRVLKAAAREREEQILGIAAREKQLESKNQELARVNDSIAAIVQRAQDGIESVSEGYALFDKEYRLVQWNSKIETLFPMYAGRLSVGTPALDLLLWSIDEAQPGDSAAEPGWIDRRAAFHEEPGIAFEQTISGRILQMTEYRTKEGGLVIVHRDITEMRQAEDKLKEKMAQLNKALESVRIANQRAKDAIGALDVGFSLFDADDRLLLWNSTYEEMLPGVHGKLAVGLHSQEIVQLAYAAALPGDDCRQPGWAAKRRRKRFALGVPFETIAGGRTLEVVEQRTAEGGLVIVHRDVTDARAQAVELNEAKIAAERASEAKTQFLANMSHEIRTPLNGVIGMTEILLDSELSQEQRMQIEIARAAADQLLQVIGNILDISKLESGALELESAPFDLAPLVEGAVQNIAAKAAARGLEVAVEIDEFAEGWYLGDQTRLRQVLLNLLNNAVKFTSEGSVSVSAKGRPSGSGFVALTIAVSDTGIGMDDGQVAKLFQKFVQADNSITRRFGGSGLGLAISKQLIEAMGGRIEVTSVPQRGSVFAIELRLPMSEGVRDYDPAPLVGKRILVVDDLELNRTIMTDRLCRWGMLVDVAHSGECALAALEADGPAYDAVLVDRSMPTMDGLEVGQEIRRRIGLRAPKLVLWSSMSGSGMSAQGAAQRIFDASLIKPVQSKALSETLTALLAGRPASGMGVAVPERDDNPLLGADILLVEDNETNQYAATTILRQLGCHVTLAENGRIALDLCQSRKFGLILMDMQMPEMDGIAATKAIRSGVNPNAHTPILALTANAFTEDAERCRNAGMNEHLTKPLRKAVLAQAMMRYLKAPEAAASALKPSIAAEAWTTLLEDFGVDALRKLTETFEVQQGAELATMSPDDRADLKRKAHSLKGSSRLFGAESLAAKAERLEDLAIDATPNEIAALTAAIVTEFSAVCRELKLKLAA